MTTISEIVADTLSQALNRPVTTDDDLARAATPDWDSLKGIEIVLALESATGVEFDPDEIADADTQSKLVELIAAKQAA